MLRSFGIRFGYYNPKDWKFARYIDPIVEMWGDIFGLTAKFLSDDTNPEMLPALIEGMKRFNGLIEKGLVHHGGKFAAGDSVSIADFVLASYVGNYIENDNCPAKAGILSNLDELPKFKAYAAAAKDVFTHLKTRGPIESPF